MTPGSDIDQIHVLHSIAEEPATTPGGELLFIFSAGWTQTSQQASWVFKMRILHIIGGKTGKQLRHLVVTPMFHVQQLFLTFFPLIYSLNKCLLNIHLGYKSKLQWIPLPSEGPHFFCVPDSISLPCWAVYLMPLRVKLGTSKNSGWLLGQMANTKVLFGEVAALKRPADICWQTPTLCNHKCMTSGLGDPSQRGLQNIL